MCGIYLTNISYQENEVKTKLNKIKFRGPDYLGVLKKDILILGHLRLAILDLDKRSNQPFQFNNLSIVYNGEIYNFKDIRFELEKLNYHFETTSDTEVLIKGYDAWGEKILDKLNGMFAFAIFDDIKQEIFCGRDRLGVKPFYYYWKDGQFEICSQLQPLINKQSKISHEAISIYLDCGYVPSPYSILENVHKLPPGNTLKINLNNKTKSIKKYWDLKPVQESQLSYDEAKNELHSLLKDAVKIRMQADVPLGSFLSGGIDSALVSAIASSISKEQINTYTIGFEDPKYDESKVAKRFSEIIDSKHTEKKCTAQEMLKMLPLLIDAYDEPFADSSALPSLLLNSVTKQNVTVALSGDGGDESFLGYVNFDNLNKYRKLSKIPFPIRKLISKLNLHKIIGGRPETIKTILRSKNADEFSWNVFTGFNMLQKKQYTSWHKNYSDYKYWAKNPLQRMADLNIKLWLENDSNVKVDRASMASSMEIRSPFLDYRIVEFARNLPIEHRYINGEKKRILKDILSEYVPSKVYNLPKKGFSVPLDYWLRTDLKEEVESILTNDFLESIPNLDVDKFKRQKKDHMKEKYNYAPNIWKLYLLGKWMNNHKISFN